MTIPGLNDSSYNEYLYLLSKQKPFSSVNPQPNTPGGIGTKKFDPAKDTKAIGSEGGMPWQTIAAIASLNLGGFIFGQDPGITSQDMIRNAGTSNGMAGGYGYTKYNNINANQIKNEYDSNNVAKLLSGNIGGFIGGLFGRSELEDRIRNALMQVNRTNVINYSTAMSNKIQDDWYSKHDNTYNQVRVAKYGLDAMVEPGEVKVDAVGNGTVEPGVGSGDRVHEKLEDTDAILSRLLGYAQKALPFVQYQRYLNSLVDKNKGLSKDVAKKVVQKELNKTQDALLAIADELKLDRQAGVIPQGDNVHAAVGWDSILGHTLTGLYGLGQYYSARNQSIKNPNTFVENQYTNPALSTLRRLFVNPYPIINLMRDAEARGRYAINSSGGLSSSLRLAANVATTSNTQNSIAQNLANIQTQNNAYKQGWANAALQAGSQAAQMKQNANQWDLDYYSKAHAARKNMMNMGALNFFTSLQQGIKDQDSYDRFKQMYNLYYLDLKGKYPKLGLS